MNNLKKTDNYFIANIALSDLLYSMIFWIPLCISYVNTLSFLGNRSENTFRRDLNFEEISYVSSLFMAFLASVLVFPCRRSNLSS